MQPFEVYSWLALTVIVPVVILLWFIAMVKILKAKAVSVVVNAVLYLRFYTFRL